MNFTEKRTVHTVHLLSVGAFGQAVATTLQSLLPQVSETRLDQYGQTHPMLWPTADVHLLAAWRPVPTLSRLLDEMSHAWRTPFIEAVMETPSLRVGPVVVPGESACYGCFTKRSLQHAQRPTEYQALRDYYDTNAKEGPQGFVPAFADIAAIRLAQMVEQLEREPLSIAGRVWHLNLMQRDTAQATVVGVHGCARCGLGRDEALRSFAALRQELDWLFGADAIATPSTSSAAA